MNLRRFFYHKLLSDLKGEFYRLWIVKLFEKQSAATVSALWSELERTPRLLQSEGLPSL